MKRTSIGWVTLPTIAAATILANSWPQVARAEPGAMEGAALLQTQPVSVSQPPQPGYTFYTGSTLRNVSASIHSPSNASPKPVLPTFVPRNLEFSTAPPSSGALDFFKVPAPDQGVRFRVGDSP